MDTLLLARTQFAFTSIFHFFFIPLTLGLSIFTAILETAYVKTGKEKYKQLTKFWGHLFLINFAVGVVTGIVMEFQLGMSWSEYARFVGDIFGVPLAIETLLAFFVESTFLGIWIFGVGEAAKGPPCRRNLDCCLWLNHVGLLDSGCQLLYAIPH